MPFSLKAPILALLLACPAVALANIGDTLDILRGRYGSAKDVGNQMLFQHGGYSICVYFDGDKAAMEVFVRDGSIPDKTDITQDDIQKLLQAESDGQAWRASESSSGKLLWVRADGKLVARLSTGEQPEDKFLTIMVNEK